MLPAFRFVLVWICALCFPLAAASHAGEARPAVLILNQSSGLPAYTDIIASLRSTVPAQTNTPTTFYGGTISAAPRHERGSVFRIVLPFARSQ
jgi:hypothetical protein